MLLEQEEGEGSRRRNADPSLSLKPRYIENDSCSHIFITTKI